MVVGEPELLLVLEDEEALLWPAACVAGGGGLSAVAPPVGLIDMSLAPGSRRSGRCKSHGLNEPILRLLGRGRKRHENNETHQLRFV
jgi:hypothetical protein